MKLRILTTAFFMVFLTTACTNDGGKLGKISDREMVKKYESCTVSEPTGTYAITCNNIVKECERRKKNGNNACSM